MSDLYHGDAAPTKDALAVVVLAGGQGRRIGGGKPMRMVGGRPLLQHALDLARRWSAMVAVAVREPLPGSEAWLIDDPAVAGPLAGVASALRFAGEQGAELVLTIPCDCPFLPENLPARLRAALASDMLAAMPASGGRPHPACVLWRPRTIARLCDYAASGRSSLLGLIEQVPHARVEWPAEPFDPFLNINSQADLDAAERLAAS